MKKLFLLSLLFTISTLSQTSDTTYINGDSLNSNNIQIFKKWDYHPGDDSTWRQVKFSSVSWEAADCRLNLDSIKANNWDGIGWFRKTVRIDSSLMNKTIAMTLNHYGASQLYVNGKLINSFGKVSKNSEGEEIYYSNSEPIIINFDSSSLYLIAVRYSNHLPIEHPYLYKRFRNTGGFYPTFKSLSEANNYYGVTQANSTATAAFICAIFLSISVIYFLLFLFYSSQKEYLYYSIFTFSLSYLFSASALTNILHSSIIYFFVDSTISWVFQLALFISLLAFLYQIFYQRLLKLYRYLLVLAITVYILQFFNSLGTIPEYILGTIVVFISIEILRVILLSIKHKKNNAWVIGTGLCVFASGILIIFILNILFGKVNLNGLYGLVFLFSVPLSMSIYLARSSSQTNKNLEIQLTNVQKLSAEAIEHEKRTSKLELESQLIKLENERKSKELEEARQLQLSMLPKTIPQLPHLDIASLHENSNGSRRRLL